MDLVNDVGKEWFTTERSELVKGKKEGTLHTFLPFTQFVRKFHCTKTTNTRQYQKEISSWL